MSKLEGLNFEIDLPGQGTVQINEAVEPVNESVDPPVDTPTDVVVVDEQKVEDINVDKNIPSTTSDTSFDLLAQDPFLGSLINKYSAGEDYLEDLKQELDRLNELKTDYGTLSDEDVIRKSLQRDNPEIKGKTFEKFFERYMSQNYPVPDLDFDEVDEDDEELQLRAALIKQDADRRRAALNSNKETLNRQPIVNIKEEQSRKQQAEQERREAEEAAWRATVRNNDFVRKVLETGAMNISKGDTTVNYSIPDKAKYEAALLDFNAFYQNLLNPDGTENHEKWAKIVAFALDPDAYEGTLISVSKGIGTEKVLDAIQNPSKKGEAPTPPANESLAQALLNSLKTKR